MGKLLLLLFIIALFFVVRGFIRSRDRSTASSSGADRVAERMVNCKHCGLYLPESEALLDRGEHYCCDQHRRLSGR